jgi:hypothetical protein
LSQSIGLLGSPANLLFESSKLRLDLRGHGQVACRICQGEVDDATRRLGDRDLRLCGPPLVERSQQGLDHGRLETVVEAWTGARVIADAEVGPECQAKRGQDPEAWLRVAAFDTRDVGFMDTDFVSELRDGDARLDAQPP